MVDLARLGLAVDSSQVEKGTVSLHQLTGAAGQASAAARQLAGASQVEAAGHKAATAATAAHTAAIQANNAAMRMGTQVRTNMIYQLNDVGVSLASGMSPLIVAVQQIPQMLQFGLKPAIDSLLGIGKSLVTTFWPIAAAVGAISVAIGGLTHEINKTSDVTVNFGDTALAVWQLVAEGIYTFIQPAVELIGGWFGAAWDWVVQATKDAGNWIIRTIVGSIEYVKTSVMTIPAAFTIAGQMAAQGLADAIAGGVNSVIGHLNSLSGAINQVAGQEVISAIAPVNFGKIEFGGTAAQSNYDDAWKGYANTIGALNERDIMGEMFGAISGRAQELALARKEAEELSGAAKAANDNVKAIGEDGLQKVTSWAEQFGQAAKSAFNDLGSGIVDAFKKGGDVASNILSMLMDRVGQLGETLLNNGLNSIFGNLLGGLFGGGMWNIPTGFKAGGFFPGFDGGGYTGSGSRSGGLDGKGGFLAMMHPKETVIDHTKGGSNDNRPVSITVQVVGARGNAEIQQMVAAGVSQGIKGYDRQLPNRLQDIQMRTG